MNVGKQATYASLILATIGIGMGFQRSDPMSSSDPGGDRTWSKHWAYEQQRSRAHRRMKNTMYASTPDRPDVTVMCPVLSDGRLGPSIAMDWRGAFLKADVGRYSAKSDEVESETALDFFLNHISSPIVQAKCVNCHVEGGVSGHTRLILHPSSNPDHGALNLAVFENFLADVEDGGDLILNKIQGVGHGGGVQVAAGSDDFANMERFLGLLGHGDGSGPGLSPETLFDTVTMASPGKTLRRAALILGGRIPTREEREAVDNGTEADLRTAIRNLMTGEGFHKFLIRASNDRLLTDRHIGDGQPLDLRFSNFVDLVNLHWTKALEAFEKGYENKWDDREYGNWVSRIAYGAARAPLELIAHVVENDLPYTEVLTADYIMANPMVSGGYGASTQFDDFEDPLEFKPSEIVSYYRTDESKVIESRSDIGDHVLDPGNLSTDYPHAGILNTTVFLLRYPTTPTNRNRARSRWTYYHFLGLDIEKSASRTTDPVALADTDNPTMNNPACTVCHRVMDPVAGAFQNYGEEGFYRDEWGGRDSLDKFYKDPPDGSFTPYQKGDSWYRDMREPGFDGQIAPNAENSLQWLAEQIVADDRFAEATVKFWWPAILGVEVAEPPEDENDADFEAMLLASNAQTAEVERLAAMFRTGIAGGEPYNLKDLLVEIVLSPWFRAESMADDDPVRLAALRNAGGERLLTPEELVWKTESITGYSWGRERVDVADSGIGSGFDYSFAALAPGERYHLLYGGIDSDGITVRTDDMTAVMAAVAQSHAAEVCCPIVRRELFLLPDENRHLLGGTDMSVTPVSEFSGSAVIEADSWKERETNSWSGFLIAGDKNVRLRYPNNYWNPETRVTRNLILDEVIVRNQADQVVERVKLETLDPVETADNDSPNICSGWPYYDDERRRLDGYELNFCRRDGWLDVPVSIPENGDYLIEVVAFQEPSIPGEEDARLEMVVESDTETSQGAMSIRNKLVELHEKLLGLTVAADSPDVEAAYRLFVEVWSRSQADGSDSWEERTLCRSFGDQLEFDGIIDPPPFNEDGRRDYDRVREIYDEVGVSEFHNGPLFRAWVVVLAYLLTDYRYLFL